MLREVSSSAFRSAETDGSPSCYDRVASSAAPRQALGKPSRIVEIRDRSSKPVKKLIKSAFRSMGLELRRARHKQHEGTHPPPNTMAATLLKWAASTDVNTVIDVGASNGCWTRLALKGWPNAQYLLVEAQRGPHEHGLITLASEEPRVEYVFVAAGSEKGAIYF